MIRPLPQAVHTAASVRGPVRVAGDQWKAICPVHDDSTPSLAVKVSDTGNLILFCHAGCQTADIVEAWGLSMRDLMAGEPTKGKGEWTPEGEASAVYDYVDEKGELLYQVLRVNKPNGKKEFRQRRPDPTRRSGWAWNLQGTRRTLYRLPLVLEAVRKGETVFIVEGEKDVHTLEKLNRTATCNSGGAGKFSPEFADIFRDGAKVMIVSDADVPGREHARMVRTLLETVGADVTVAEPGEGCKDTTDHINAGFGLDELRIIEDPGMPDLGLIDIHDLIMEEEEEYDWLVPDLLEKGERVIITGIEGSGKSMLLRQIATMVAAGVHPLVDSKTRTIHPIAPQRVLWVDAENSKRQNRRTMAPLVGLTSQLDRRIPDGGFTLALRPEGMDLHKPQDADWLAERIAIIKPDLLVIGPWYRLFSSDPSDELATRHVIAAIDSLRAKYGFTTLIEAHSPHSTGGPNRRGGVRPVRPIGSSILLRWPEYGYGLSFRDNNDPDTPDVNGLPDFTYADWIAWRGARDERNWPQALTRGSMAGDPPWLACEVQPMESTPGDRENQRVRTDTQNAYQRGRGGVTGAAPGGIRDPWMRDD